MKFIVLIIGIMLTTSCDFILVKKQTVEDVVQFSREWGYYDGQVDAINGDIRVIRCDGDSTYVWKKSPWNSGKSPIYNPLATIDENLNYLIK